MNAKCDITCINDVCVNIEYVVIFGQFEDWSTESYLFETHVTVNNHT